MGDVLDRLIEYEEDRVDESELDARRGAMSAKRANLGGCGMPSTDEVEKS